MTYITPLRKLNSLTAAGLILVCLFMLGNSAAAADDESKPEQRLMRVEERSEKGNQSMGTWEAMLKFDTPATYQYRLVRTGADGSVSGSMTVTASRLYVAFSYELDGVTDGTIVRTKAVTPGEALMAALLASDRWTADDIRLIWTPFMFTKWADQFVQMQWHDGLIWATRSAGTEEFFVDQVLRNQDDNTVFRGHLSRNNQTVLDLDVNLNRPLPEYILWVDHTGAIYKAEMVWE